MSDPLTRTAEPASPSWATKRQTGDDVASAPGAGSGPAGGLGRWGLAVAVGSAMAVPFGMLLSYVSFLMAYLGLFFYALFGLVIGAAVVRVAAPRRPLGKGSVLMGTTGIVLLGWGLSLRGEIVGLPRDIAKLAVENRTRLPEGMSKADYVASVEQDVRSWLAHHYPPGGAIGYVRWITDSGRFPKGTFEGVHRELARPQRRWVWTIRVVLSVILFSFGVASMTWPLTSPASTAKPVAAEPVA